MKRTRFTEEQIVAILKQSEAGLKTAELCRQNGISEATFYNGKAKYGGMAVSDVQKLKRLEEENAKRKRVVADLTLDNVVLKRPVIKKLLEPASKRAAVTVAMKQHGISERRACRLTQLARSTQRRKLPSKTDDDFAQRLTELARERQRFGYRRLTALLRREGGTSTISAFIECIEISGWPCEDANIDTAGSGSPLPQRSTWHKANQRGRWTSLPTHWHTAVPSAC